MLYQKPQLRYYIANARKSSKQMLAVVERQDLNAMMLMLFAFLFLNVTIQIIIFYCIHGGINEKEKQF